MLKATGDNLMKGCMTYTYEYDKTHRMYPTCVTDGFGYRSDMFNYDYRYGIPLSVKDINGFITKHEIDNLGRITKVRAPNELSTGKDYTVRYVEDGSGAQEYFSGKMGEVTKLRRTLIIPGVDVATYTTEWKYDSWNRIQEMIYPDGEKIKYYYNSGGQLKQIIGEKNYLCTYIDDIG